MGTDELDWNRTLREQLEHHWNQAPIADLVLHFHRELIHHLSEVCLLRDIFLHTNPATNGATR